MKRPRSFRSLAPLLVVPALVAGLAAAKPAGKPTPAEAKAFVDRVNRELGKLAVKSMTADWIKNTYITDDTERNAAAANSVQLEFLGQAVKEAARFRDLKLDADTARMLHLLRVSNSVVAPSDPAQRDELTALGSKLEGLYGKAKGCGADGKGKCRDIEELTGLFAKSRDWNELLDAWTGWHRAAREMRPLYTRYVALANKGAQEIGFADMGQMWRSSYDMSPDAFERSTDKMWDDLRPLYQELHCYVRSRLAQVYGKDKVPETGPIPAHVLGNMWAQDWSNVYDLVEPYKGQPSLDVSASLVAQKADAVRMVKLGESFFTSMGLDPLPATFWERSMLTKPRDREVVCHASAWDVQFANDLRIKMCIKPTEEDLVTIHHELGHDYYFHYYYTLPFLYQQGANDGFHEAIGDALTLSITPAYLQKIGLLKDAPKDERGLINVQMKDALEKIAFLPFGKLIDQWRWDVLSGKVEPADYNKKWWELRRKFQGVAPAVTRGEEDFDPGAKYHVPANVSYTRYFLARLLQFQFHRALCKIAGHQGPLHTCSVYGNKAAGDRFKAMLALGASKPWPEALEVLTGQKEVDASAMLEYFAPLRRWLGEQNKGKSCGW